MIFLLGNENGEGQSYKPNCMLQDQNFYSERSTEENTEEKETKMREEEKREKMKMSKELTVSASIILSSQNECIVRTQNT